MSPTSCLCALDVQTAAMSRRGNNAGGAASNEFWAKKAENFNASGISMSGEGKPGVYVPRHKRGGTSMASERDQQPSLRVTNLSQATMEEDLRELFGAFGRVTRVYIVRCALVLGAPPHSPSADIADVLLSLMRRCVWRWQAKDNITQQSRGFAFVSFENKCVACACVGRDRIVAHCIVAAGGTPRMPARTWTGIRTTTSSCVWNGQSRP